MRTLEAWDIDNHPGVKTQDFFTLWCKSYLKQAEAATLGGPVSVVTLPKPTPPKTTLKGSQGQLWSVGGQPEAIPAESEEALGVPAECHQLQSF